MRYKVNENIFRLIYLKFCRKYTIAMYIRKYSGIGSKELLITERASEIICIRTLYVRYAYMNIYTIHQGNSDLF